MKQAIPNIRTIIADIRASLPSYPASQQSALDKLARAIGAELDILEGAKRGAVVEPVEPVAGDSHVN
jgi:hypothetical protein